MARAFDVSEVVDAATQLRGAARLSGRTLHRQVEEWAQATARSMRREIPEVSGETRRSVTVDRPDELTATVGPTNRDEQGRPVGFFLQYGPGNRQPDDFIGRTAVHARKLAGEVDPSGVL
jgi:hypothetical protein